MYLTPQYQDGLKRGPAEVEKEDNTKLYDKMTVKAKGYFWILLIAIAVSIAMFVYDFSWTSIVITDWVFLLVFDFWRKVTADDDDDDEFDDYDFMQFN